MAISLVRTIVDELDRRGMDGVAVLAEAGVEPVLIEDAQARLDLSRYDRLQRLAVERSDDAAFGLHMGEHASLASFSVVGHMVAHCRTLREGLELLLQYYRLVADVAPPSIVEDGLYVRLVYEFVRSPDPVCNRVRAEFGLTRLLLVGRHFLGPEAAPEEAWFEHEAPGHAAEYTRIFQGRERFEQPLTGFLVRRDMLDARQVHHDAQLLSALKERADRWLERLDEGQGLAFRIRRVIVEGHPDVRPEMEIVARRLGTSERSLRRRLRAEGLLWEEVVQKAMGELACSMLKKPDATIQETAFRLGFSDPSSFHRAFKRWTGITPSEFRRGS